MVETPEGIGSQKFSLSKDIVIATAEGLNVRFEVALMQGKTVIAALSPEGETVKSLLVTAPQLWDAANDLIRELVRNGRTDLASSPLANMVAKSVGKTDWKDVAQ